MPTEEKNEKKVRSIRADEETYNKFKSICEETGGQAEGLSALVSSYELGQAKEVLSGQADNIDDFKARIDGIIRAYINALDMTVNSEERIRAEFSVRLDNQEKTIADLRERAKNSECQLKAVELATSDEMTKKDKLLDEYKKSCTELVERTQTAQKECKQAEDIAVMCKDQLNTVKAKLETVKDKAEKSDEYKIELEKIANEKNKLLEKISSLEQKIEQTKKEEKLLARISVAETIEKYIQQIEIIQKEHNAQVQNYIEKIEKYQLLLEQKKQSRQNQKN